QQPQQQRGHRDKEPALVGLQPFDLLEVGHKVEGKAVRHEDPQCPEEGVNQCESQSRTQKACLLSQQVVTLAKISLDAPPNRAEPGHERSEHCKDDEIRDLGPVDVEGADGLYEVPVEGDYGEEHRQRRRSRPSIPGTYGHRKQQQKRGRDAEVEVLKEQRCPSCDTDGKNSKRVVLELDPAQRPRWSMGYGVIRVDT